MGSQTRVLARFDKEKIEEDLNRGIVKPTCRFPLRQLCSFLETNHGPFPGYLKEEESLLLFYPDREQCEQLAKIVSCIKAGEEEEGVGYAIILSEERK